MELKRLYILFLENVFQTTSGLCVNVGTHDVKQSGQEGKTFITFHSPFIPLPSSWNVLRVEVWSSKCSLPPLPEEATLLCGDRGAWSEGMPWGPLSRKSSWDIHPCPRGWLGTVMGGVRDTDRFRGLWWVWLERTETNKVENKLKQAISFPRVSRSKQTSPLNASHHLN